MSIDKPTMRTLRQHLHAQIEQSRTQKIVAYVAAHPGCSMPQICDGTGLARNNAASQLSELTKRGQLHRAGLRTEYVYFTDAAQRDAQAAAIRQAQQAARKERNRKTLRDRQQRKSQARAAARNSMLSVPRKMAERAKKPRELTTHGKVEAYVDAHQGVSALDIRTHSGVFGGSVSYAIQRLRREKVLFMLGKRGNPTFTPLYFTDRAAYKQAAKDRKSQQAAASAAVRKEQRDAQARRSAELEQKRQEQAEKAAARKALQEAAQARRREEALARQRAAAEAKADRQRLADQRLEQREAAERLEQQRRQAMATPAPALPSVNLPPQDWASSVTQTRHAGYVYTVIKARPGRFDVDLKPGDGVISRDWAERRAAQQMNSGVQA